MPRRIRSVLAGLALAAMFAPTARAGWPSDPSVGFPVCTVTGEQQQAQLTSDGNGGCWLTWADARVASTDLNIFVQHVLASGQRDPLLPPDGFLACGASRSQTAPVIAPDGAGGVIVVWWDQRLSNGNPDLYLQHVFADGTRDPLVPANGVGIRTTLDFQYPPSVMADGSGGVYVGYGSINPTNDVYLQRVTATGATSPGWPPLGVLLSPVNGEQFFRDMIGDGAGGVLVGWSDERSGPADIYVGHVLSSGSVDPAWPATGALVCGATGAQETTRMTADGAGGALLTWYDQRSDANGDVYAHHVLATGVVDPAWPPDGVAVCTATGVQVVSVAPVNDGAGGMVVVWRDQRGGNFDLYSSHVLANGTLDPAIPPQGQPLCLAAGDQVPMGNAHQVSDGAGGMWVAWSDARNGAAARDIYATHVLASGQRDPAWPVNGRAVCDGTGDQLAPTAGATGTGGLFVAWADRRTGEGDLYLQRVNPDGTLDAPHPGAAPELRLGVPRPNPATSSVLLRLELPAGGVASAQVLDVSGRLVRALAIANPAAGTNELRWDVRDEAGQHVPAGLYFVRVRSGARFATRRVAVLD